METPALLQKFYSHLPPGASRIYNMPGSFIALFLSLQEDPFVVIEKTEDAAVRLYEDTLFFKKLLQRDCKGLLFLPEPNGPESSGRRAEALYSIGNCASIVTSVNAMNAPMWSPEDLKRDSLLFVRGQEMERDFIEHRLRHIGYKRVSIVVEKGEYSAKGWLFDIFPSTTDNPVRIELFGDEVENIRLFDIESQRSISSIDELIILPASEPSYDCGTPSGLFDCERRFRMYDVEGCFSLSSNSPELSDSSQRKAVNKYIQDSVILSRFDFKGDGFDAGLTQIRGFGICHDERKSLDDLTSAVGKLIKNNRVIIVSASKGQAERVRDILFDGGIIAPIVEKGDVTNYQGAIVVTAGRLSSGFFMQGLLLLAEKDIFGERTVHRPLKKSKISGLIASIDDISPGDLVVHRDHGIGRFISIQKQAIGGYETELIALDYRDNDRLYIPIYNIEKIKKYSAEEGVSPHLDKLGGKTWQKTKNKAKKAIKDMAEKLLMLYAERELSGGFSYSPDTELHREFYGFFQYEETPDQLRTIEEICSDMQSERPMDRLLCGDVGYGKTEVAMRAAFKAVYDGRQAAVLVPTTILCEQHYMTFKERFSAFPVRIDYLSRFKSKKEQDLTLKPLARGEIDIIIATHSLLRKDILFSNLGLLIIDEEHKFGVAQKERIKEIKKGIDVLSMTATPIPRTLQMALSGIRGMSVIETPPEDRLAVRSIVSVFSENLIKEAIERELKRSGQVLFVHNFIIGIEKMADMLKRLFPDAKIAVGHGQMTGKTLEDVMLRFMRGEIDILVSTNIIGSGIDVPAANTIIINRADKIGLADLYQLRGRVGRSNVRAYAYFLIPGEDIIRDEAKKRLQAIKDLSFLGAGFRLAMKDMEIRGAGNLLGQQQSGHIHAVGLEMYVEMLERAVSDLKGIETREETEPSINLKLSAFIPGDYIEDLTIRLSVYRRIANIKALEDIKEMESEMTDRFGELPEEVKRLLDIMKLKIAARKLHIANISETDGRIRLVFPDIAGVLSEKILCLQKTFDDIRFYKDGFELALKDSDAVSAANSVMKTLT